MAYVTKALTLRRVRRFVGCLVIGSLLTLFVWQERSEAGSYTLAQLAATNGDIDIGGWRFEGFGVGNQAGITPDEVIVTPLGGTSIIGLSFTPASGGFSVSGSNGFDYLAFQYYVQALTPGPPLTGSGLAMTGDASGNGYATSEADVYQYPSSINFNPLALNGTYVSALFGSQLTSSAQFPPQTYIEVDSNIQLVSPDDSSSANLTSFTETFNLSSIPEPTSLIPLGSGVIAIASAACYRCRTSSRRDSG